MKKTLFTLFILFFSVGAYAQVNSLIPRAYSEIGKCVNAIDKTMVLRLLIDAVNESGPNNALIVSELPDPTNESDSFMSAFSADFESRGEDQGGKIKFGTDEIDLVSGEVTGAQLGFQLYKCSLNY